MLVYSYESRTQRILPGDSNERILRFLLGTVLVFPFVAVVAGAVYVRILHVPAPGAGHRNRLLDPSGISLWWTLVPVLYVAGPWAAGWLLGRSRVRREERSDRPRLGIPGWQFAFNDPGPKLVVVRLRSGSWVGGLFGKGSYASPAATDVVFVLAAGVEVDGSGAVQRDEDGTLLLTPATMVVSYADVELMKVEPA